MARELRRWLAATLGACGLVALAYVPPRGVAPAPKPRDRQPQPTTARRHAQALAERWRAADLALRLAQYREQLEPELARRRESDQPGAALLVDGPDTIPASTRELVRSSLDTVWRELGLGVSKVAVGVVVDFWRNRTATAGQTPKATHELWGYLLPDSMDRETCVALIPSFWWTRTLFASGSHERNRQIEDWLRAGLGQCAFFAAYGVPGKAVARWLAWRHYDLARFPNWDRDRSEGPEWLWWVMDRDTKSWRWQAVYAHPIGAIGCLAGRAESCRTAVLSGAADASDDSLPRLFTSDAWWWREQRLLYGERYLGDVARQVGHDRFLRFWNSTEPVDTALAAALKMPVGEWTARWQRRLVPRLPLGAAPSAGGAALGILLAGTAVLAVALGAARREVG